jgi:hypothetical protein
MTGRRVATVRVAMAMAVAGLLSATVLLAPGSRALAGPVATALPAAGKFAVVADLPETGPTQLSQLYAVRCLAASDCWAVGQYQKGETDQAEALHWNGRKWSTSAVPSPGGTKAGDTTSLIDSTCISASNCWAAGDYGKDRADDFTLLNLLLHWNGSKWTNSAVPQPGGTKTGSDGYLNGTVCSSVSNC